MISATLDVPAAESSPMATRNATMAQEPASTVTETRSPDIASHPVVLPKVQRIVLTGFMGAGKSTVGGLLAQELGWQFIDVDKTIEAKAGIPVAEIFNKHGEFVFRRMETSAIARALGERNAVIALGGGAPEVLANRLLLEQTPMTSVVFLEAPLELLIARCDSQNGAVRPNLKDRTAAEERFLYRLPLYRRCARHRVSTDGLSATETKLELLSLFKE